MNQPTQLRPQPTGSLEQFRVLIGEWDMVGRHPAFPSAVQGHSSFTWLIEGALLVWHFDWDRPGPPSAMSVIGRDDAFEACSMLYADERGVARIYQMTLSGDTWRLWRDSPGFSQRMTGKVSGDGDTITVQGELARNGSSWEQDLDVIYTRMR